MHEAILSGCSHSLQKQTLKAVNMIIHEVVTLVRAYQYCSARPAGMCACVRVCGVRGKLMHVQLCVRAHVH